MSTLPKFALKKSLVQIDDKEFNLRPFVVGQENLLLMVKDSNEGIEIYDTVIQIVDECWVDRPEGVSVGDKPQHVTDLLFLKTRAISNGPIMEVRYLCNAPVKNEEGEVVPCKNWTDVEINIDEVKKAEKPEPITYFKFDADMQGANVTIGVELKQIALNKSLRTKKGALPEELLSDHVSQIVFGDDVIDASSVPKEELIEWCKSIPSSVRADMSTQFFKNLPKIYLAKEFTCECGQKHKVEFNSLLDFFL